MISALPRHRPGAQPTLLCGSRSDGPPAPEPVRTGTSATARVRPLPHAWTEAAPAPCAVGARIGAQIGAQENQATGTRTGYRGKTPPTSAGGLEPAVPQVRREGFLPRLIERRRRIGKVLHTVVMGPASSACPPARSTTWSTPSARTPVSPRAGSRGFPLLRRPRIRAGSRTPAAVPGGRPVTRRTRSTASLPVRKPRARQARAGAPPIRSVVAVGERAPAGTTPRQPRSGWTAKSTGRDEHKVGNPAALQSGSRRLQAIPCRSDGSGSSPGSAAPSPVHPRNYSPRPSC
ncbi:transposase [Streptacidiphilus sp. ASG 303]|uniref:transposase n=1 Tax=Streptacidiphilus sp. ASG 303 TaxID=2896847 RepID=UPI0035B30487